MNNFAELMGQYVRETLREGLSGWPVTDCTILMIECNYSSWDGPPATRGPLSTAADYRKLTPVVVMEALERAGTVVCEPILRVWLEIPTTTMGAVQTHLARLGATVSTPSPRGDFARMETQLPAARVPDLHRQLPGLTAGEGVLESDFAGYRPVAGNPPTRRRTTANPLNRDEYLMHLRQPGQKFR